MARGPVPVVVTLLLKVMAMPFNETPAAAVVLRGPLKRAAPVRFAAEIEAADTAFVVKLFALLIVTTFKGVVAPTVLPKVTFPPPAVRVMFSVPVNPLTALLKTIFPAFAELSNVLENPTMTGPVKEILPLLVVIEPPIAVVPAPFWMNEPSIEAVIGAAPSVRPLLVSVNEPPLVVVMFVAKGPMANILPARLIPTGVLDVRLPKRVDVPVPKV